ELTRAAIVFALENNINAIFDLGDRILYNPNSNPEQDLRSTEYFYNNTYGFYLPQLRKKNITTIHVDGNQDMGHGGPENYDGLLGRNDNVQIVRLGHKTIIALNPSWSRAADGCVTISYKPDTLREALKEVGSEKADGGDL